MAGLVILHSSVLIWEWSTVAVYRCEPYILGWFSTAILFSKTVIPYKSMESSRHEIAAVDPPLLHQPSAVIVSTFNVYLNMAKVKVTGSSSQTGIGQRYNSVDLLRVCRIHQHMPGCYDLSRNLKHLIPVVEFVLLCGLVSQFNLTKNAVRPKHSMVHHRHVQPCVFDVVDFRTDRKRKGFIESWSRRLLLRSCLWPD